MNSSKNTQNSHELMHLSKKLCWLLRHGAESEGIPIAADGYISVDDILQHHNYKEQYTSSQIANFVKNDAKQRFGLKECPAGSGQLFIRANQGHSLGKVKADKCLKPIEKADQLPSVAVHGTNYKHWNAIKAQGLRCMGRNHVHFATNDHFTRETGISGIRGNVELLIYLDVSKALMEGKMKLYLSENGVLLSSGIDDRIPKEYFLQVLDRKTRKKIEF